jgi:hypothetical protein
MARFLFDLRFALRSLGRSPLFTLVAVAQPEQLVMIWSTGPHMGSNRGARMASYPMYQDFQKKALAFSSVFCRFSTAVSLSFKVCSSNCIVGGDASPGGMAPRIPPVPRGNAPRLSLRWGTLQLANARLRARLFSASERVLAPMPPIVLLSASTRRRAS